MIDRAGVVRGDLQYPAVIAINDAFGHCGGRIGQLFSRHIRNARAADFQCVPGGAGAVNDSRRVAAGNRLKRNLGAVVRPGDGREASNVLCRRRSVRVHSVKRGVGVHGQLQLSAVTDCGAVSFSVGKALAHAPTYIYRCTHG